MRVRLPWALENQGILGMTWAAARARRGGRCIQSLMVRQTRRRAWWTTHGGHARFRAFVYLLVQSGACFFYACLSRDGCCGVAPRRANISLPLLKTKQNATCKKLHITKNVKTQHRHMKISNVFGCAGGRKKRLQGCRARWEVISCFLMVDCGTTDLMHIARKGIDILCEASGSPESSMVIYLCCLVCCVLCVYC